ncbi:MAG: Hint domain-containing protein [Pseudomonadota bacterium]
MATRTIAGIFRSDAGFSQTDHFEPGNSFSSDLITQITIELGADDTIFDGDGNVGTPENETLNDPTQTYDDGGGPRAFGYDFTIEVIGSNGVTYQLVAFDYDLNNDGDVGTGFVGEEDPGENGYFMAFTGALPPPGITLTTTNVFIDNSPSLPIQNVVICLTQGTMIQTKRGVCCIEKLSKDDQVLTLDRDYQPIRWIGTRRLDAYCLEASPKLKPILIRADALGLGYPATDLRVSPQHRILVRSEIARRMFGSREVLVPANKLLVLDGIDVQRSNPEGVEYFHILFDQHEIIRANGAWTESLFTGPEALKSLSAEARSEIKTLFPQICDPDFEPIAVRYIPEKGQLMKKLALRHAKNNKPLYTTC